MKLGKLSLVAALTIGNFCAVNASDTLSDMFLNGKLTSTLNTHYTSYEDERKDPKFDESIFGMGIELEYTTDSFYGFRLGIATQGWESVYSNNKVKTYSNKEWYANGFVLSEAYLGYTLEKTDIKIGRQYVVSPVVAINPTRAFKEAFEGVSVTNKDIANTELFAGWYYKFQGRSKVVMSDNDPKKTGAPIFKNRAVLGGLGPVAFEFDDVFTVAVASKSLNGLTLTAAYGVVINVNKDAGNKNDNSDVNLYFAEASYTMPVANFKLGFDVNYKVSRAEGWMKNANVDGKMIGLRAKVSELHGFNASYAYTTMSDNDLVFGVGNGAVSYTMLPIFGPYQWTGYANMNTHKFMLGYDFGAIGIKGLNAGLHIVKGKQDAQPKPTYTTSANEKMDFSGHSLMLDYKADSFIKGLNTSLTYTALTREKFVGGTKKSKTDTDELWIRFAYKFDILSGK